MLKFLNNIILLGISYKWLNNKETKCIIIPTVKTNLTNETSHESSEKILVEPALSVPVQAHQIKSPATPVKPILVTQTLIAQESGLYDKFAVDTNEDSYRGIDDLDIQPVKHVNKKKRKRKTIVTSSYYRCKRLVIFSSYSKNLTNGKRNSQDACADKHESSFEKIHKCKPKLID